MRFLLALLTVFTANAWACSPPADFRVPSVADNYKTAKTVVFGTIETRGPSAEGFSYQFKIQKAWKGTLLKSLQVTSGTGNTCDGFPQTAEVGATCVLFLDASNKIFSGVENGQASICVPAGSERSKTLMSEYDSRFGPKDETAECEAKGGRWEGTVRGRGRLTGCNLPTSDGGKACKSGDDCQSVCLKEGVCYGWSKYKGCAQYRGHKGVICVD